MIPLSIAILIISAAAVALLPRYFEHRDHQDNLLLWKQRADARLRLHYRGTIIEDRYGLH